MRPYAGRGRAGAHDPGADDPGAEVYPTPFAFVIDGKIKTTVGTKIRFFHSNLSLFNGVKGLIMYPKRLDEMGEAGVRRVVLYGASDVARILLGMVNGEGLEVVGVIDGKYEGHEFQGVPVIERLEDMEWDGVLITALDDFETVEEQLRKLGVASEGIWKLS